MGLFFCLCRRDVRVDENTYSLSQSEVTALNGEQRAVRRRFILFPQSSLGKVLLYLVLFAQIMMYVNWALSVVQDNLIVLPLNVLSAVMGNFLFLWLVRYVLVRVGLLKIGDTTRTGFKRLFVFIGLILLLGMVVVPMINRGGILLRNN